jgi:hypothetical protein
VSRKKNIANGKGAVANLNEPKPLPAAVRTGLWLPWGYAPPNTPGGKPAKRPVYLEEFNRPIFASISEPSQWTDYDTAAANFAKVGSPWKDRRTGEVLWTKAGLGRLCASEPELTVIDVDGCIDDGKLNPAAVELVRQAATYTEVSPSGNGLRLALKGGKPEAIRLAEVGTLSDGTRVECYDASSTRYVTFTGIVPPALAELSALKAAGWSKGFVKWFAENWKRPAGSAARGSLRLVTEQRLAALQEGFANKNETQTVPFDQTRFLVPRNGGNTGLDRSAAFASLFSRLYGDPEVGAAEALSVTLNTLGDDLADKGTRKVIVTDTGEILRVPFAVADAAKIAADIDERFEVKHAINDNLPKVPTDKREALVRQFHERYPQHAWQVAHAALKHGMKLSVVRAIVGEEVVQSVATYMQSVQARDRRSA